MEKKKGGVGWRGKRRTKYYKDGGIWRRRRTEEAGMEKDGGDWKRYYVCRHMTYLYKGLL